MFLIANERFSLSRYLSDVIKKKRLIYLLTKRDISVKYAQTILGFGWTIVQPLTGMVIFTIFFTKVFSIDDTKIGIPYHLFSYSGFICWILFSNIISGAGTSLLQEENLIKKVYFPRIIVPLSKTLNYYFDFLFSFFVLILISLFYDFNVIWRFVFVVPSLFLILINSFTIAIWLSALTMRFRDFNHIIPYIVNFGIWLTPVFFPLELLPENIRFLVQLNPMAFNIELFRSSIFGLDLPELSVSVILIQLALFVVLVLGVKYFIRIDRLMSDYL
jgi:lipopolysaccharide transport system permease protein